MYFSIEPKGKKEDFFNYEYEYEEMQKALKRREKIIAVLGVRRVGKTSLLNIFYREAKGLKVWLDGRIISDPKKEIFSVIYEVAKTGETRIFGKIDSLNISAFGIGLNVKVASESIIEMEKKISASGNITVFIDEAQKIDIKNLADVLSYFYDRLPNVSFVLSGSEVGLVEHVLGENDSAHPLYGRHITKIIMKRLDKNRAFEFLSNGFKQLNIKETKDEIYRAIDELDGLVGWLTLYGYEKAVLKNNNALEKTMELAANIVASEIINFTNALRNKKLYLAILRNSNRISWNELKTRTEITLKEQLNPKSFSFAVEKLVACSFLENENGKYFRSDPLILKALFLVK